MQIIAKDKHWGAVQATNTGLSYRKGISLQRKDASCKVTGKVGYTFQGKCCMSLLPAAVNGQMPIAMLGCISHVANTAAASCHHCLSSAIELLKKFCKLCNIVVRNFITSRETEHMEKAPTYHTGHHSVVT